MPATDTAAHRVQADALAIESTAKRRMADEYDAAKERGEVAGYGGARNFKIPDGNLETATIDELGLSGKQIHEGRMISKAETADPGIVERTVDELVDVGQEPTRAAVAMITLITKPHLQRRGAEYVHIDKFEAWLDGELIVTSKQPRLDGARELLKRGYPAEMLLTTKAEGRSYDSWEPAPIGELAKWTVTERDRDGLRREKWKPLPNAIFAPAVDGGTRKSPLRGVRIPKTDDDAVAPGRRGCVTERTDAA